MSSQDRKLKHFGKKKGKDIHIETQATLTSTFQIKISGHITRYIWNTSVFRLEDSTRVTED